MHFYLVNSLWVKHQNGGLTAPLRQEVPGRSGYAYKSEKYTYQG